MIQKTTLKTKCDVFGCRNCADYYFDSKSRSGKTFLCKDCLKKLNGDAVSLFVPKSPKNTIKRIIDDKQAEVLHE